MFLTYFPKAGLCYLLSLCVCIPPYERLNARTSRMKLGMCIMAHEPISTAYFVNPSHQPVCLYVYPL
jgi:hypothetical protein